MFHAQSSKRRGRQYRCKTCQAEYQRDWLTRDGNKAKRASTRSKNRRAYSKAKRLFNQAKRRAKTQNREFSLRPEDVQVPEFCPVLGLRLETGSTEGSLPNNPSLDRIDNTKGYTPDNVWVISYRANRIKNDASLDELKALVAAIEAASKK